MKGKAGCFKKGGGVKNRAMEADVEHEAEEKKKGGAVKRASGGRISHMHEAHGKKAKHRVDKKARGGKVGTPGSPLSGAMASGLPGGGKGEKTPDKSND